jgi:Glycogen recognition site of AMP-activated protein kinase
MVVALCCVAAVPSRAQRVVPTIDIGGSRVRYADSISSSGAAFSPAVGVDWDHATFGAFGTFSQFVGGWSTQGGLDLSLYTPAAGAFVGELSGSSGGSAHQDGTRTGESIAVVRGHVMNRWAGGWVGAGTGATWDGAAWNAVRIGEAAAWAHGGMFTALVTLSPTRVTDSIRFTDAELAVRFVLPHADIGLTGGHRTGNNLPTLGGSSRSWASLTTTAWIAPKLAFVASVGTYPVDFTQGYPGGQFVTVALRLGSRGSRHSDLAETRRSHSGMLQGEPTSSSLGFQMLGGPPGRRTLRVHVAGATNVEIAGDFTDWKPVRLTPAESGWWTLTLPIESGVHQVNYRVDGGAWSVPPGLAALSDEFNGSVGLLSVP